MKRGNVIQGRIGTHGAGLGTATEETVRARAREVAITNGRQPEEVTSADYDQARQELQARQAPDLDEAEVVDGEQEANEDSLMGVSHGTETPAALPIDEQDALESLVTEGAEEAAHDSMVQGNKESRRRDERFDDQLPSA